LTALAIIKNVTTGAQLVSQEAAVAADVNKDNHLSNEEFQSLFGLSGTNSMINKLMNPNAMPNNQYTDSQFPMPDMTVANKRKQCHCQAMLGEGWSGNSVTGQCMKRSITSCTECEHQTKCATMQTVVGDGLRDFEGDCPASYASGCKFAPSASLSHPVSIAIDEENNIYIADYGNNRIRVVWALNNTIETIAGSGELGYSGDTGKGINAAMRYPEGIAVNNVQRLNSEGVIEPREVYFSDFYNQRVRKVTFEPGFGWRIDTVVGTGVKASHPLCDSDVGCDKAHSYLNDPRALAFSFDQDLFIVDSGNRKIRQLLFTIGSGIRKTGNMTTLLGYGEELSQKSFDSSMKIHEGVFLSGLWGESNKNVAMKSIYSLQIDTEDNLWFVDASNNRVYMTPLKADGKRTVKADGYIGRFLEYYRLHFGFGSSSESSTEYQESILDSMSKWLPYECTKFNGTDSQTCKVDGDELFPKGEKVRKFDPSSHYQKGNSYWKFASPLKGQLCKKMEDCEPRVAQFQKFARILGVCFDAGGEQYVTDQVASQIMRVS
jgi:hypothetical protein